MKVIVLGKNYLTPLGIIRALAKAGYTVELLYIASKKGDSSIAEASKYLSRVVEIVGRNDQAVFNALVSMFASEGTKNVLFPTDDYTASLIDHFRDALKGMFYMPYIIEGSVSEMMNKSIQANIAQKCGLKTAKEWVVSLNTDRISIPNNIIFPCFVKPLVSALGRKSELEKCENYQALETKLYKMQSVFKERSVLVQEFLNIQKEYTIGGVCNDQVIFLPAVIEKSMIAQHNRGITLSGKVIDPNEISEALPLIVTFLKRVRYVGMFDMEILKTDKGIFFGELNLRCGGPSYSYFRCGINLPKYTIQAILHQKFDESSDKVKLNQRFFNNKAAWEDYMDGYISNSDIKNLYKDCEISLLTDESDPDPEKMFNKVMKPYYQQRRLKHKIKKLITL